jgi:hypothetical protein
MGEGEEGLGAGGRALRVNSLELLHNDWALARGEERPVQPIEFVRDEGRTPHDLVGTTYATLVLVSNRFQDVLREHQVSGWTTFPISLHVEGSDLAGYQGFAVTGRCGPIDDSLSEQVLLPPPVPGGRSRRGLRGICFAPESWDGSDIFTPDGMASSFVVRRVKDLLEEAAVTNVAFQRLSEIERIWRSDKRLVGH